VLYFHVNFRIYVTGLLVASYEDLLKFVLFYRPETNFIVRKTTKGKHCMLVVSTSIKSQLMERWNHHMEVMGYKC